jgi:hypothetical protein
MNNKPKQLNISNKTINYQTKTKNIKEVFNIVNYQLRN